MKIRDRPRFPLENRIQQGTAMRLALGTRCLFFVSILAVHGGVLAQVLSDVFVDAACREALRNQKDPAQRFLKAAECGDINIVSRSLDDGVPMNATEPWHGKTAIHLASEHGKARVVDLLLKRGAEPDSVIASYTPLIHAAVGGYTDVVQLLLASGADPNREYAYGTPLIAAVRHRNLRVVEALLRAGALVNYRAKSRGGETALHTIAQRNDWRQSDSELIQTLLDAGANPVIADDLGRTVIGVANSEAKKILERYVARTKG